jgi:hypothetical protein
VKFYWQSSSDALKVRLEVAKNPDLKQPLLNKEFTSINETTVAAHSPGEYYARVSGFYPESSKPVTGKTIHFNIRMNVKDPVKIEWQNSQLTQTLGAKSELDMHWQAKNRQSDIASYQVNLSGEEGGDEPVRLPSPTTTLKAPVPAPGRYLASVDALDKDGKVIGTSEPVTLTALEMPLLKAPQLLPPEGELKSGMDGRTQLQWTPIAGAKHYVLTVTNKDGKQLLNKVYPDAAAKLKNLMPGEYELKVETVDALGRGGEPGQPRKLLVPEKSDVKSPKLKKVLVE